MQPEKNRGSHHRGRPPNPLVKRPLLTGLEQLSRDNQESLDWLRRSDSAVVSPKPAVLLAFPPQGLRQFLLQNVDQAQLEILTRKNAWWRVVPLLLRRYDSALYFGDGQGWQTWPVVGASAA